MTSSEQPHRVRVVHLTTVHHPFDTRIFYKELQTLVQAGYEVTLIAPHQRDEVVAGVSVRAIPPVAGKLRRVLTSGWRVIRRAMQEEADLFHIHDPELLLWSQILRLRGQRVIYDMHENVAQDLRYKTWISEVLRKPLAWIYRFLERVLIRRMPIIFAENSYVPFYRWHRGPQAVILNMPLADQLLAVNETSFPYPTLGYVGDVKPWRGSLVTLKALDLLKQRGLDVAWECVGQLTDDHRQEMEAYIQQHSLTRIRLHDRLGPEVWHSIIARCHVGLAVLADVPNHVHSYPTKMFEYMALGIPVIATGFPLYREVVEGVGCGLTVNDPDDAQELAERIQYLLDRPEEAAAMGQRGRAAVFERFRWDIEAKKLLDFYATLLNPN